jgi:predicted ArsR family transcriptional regulator
MAEKLDRPLKNGEKMWPPMERPIRALGRRLLSNSMVNQTDLCLATGLPSWKISRLFRRLEVLGFVKVELEPRFIRGRPKKLYKLTENGILYFTNLLRKAGDDNNIEGCASSAARDETRGD